MYDTIIVGGGPAGIAGGVYASRKQLKTLFITDEWGGQSSVSTDIQNWIGTISISGMEFAETLKKHLLAYAPGIVDIKERERVTQVEKLGKGFKVTTNKGSYEGKTVLIAAGASRKKLKVPGALEFEQKGVVYCASCDGPLFSDMDVAVIGGGNAAFESAAQLLAYCKSVTLIHHSPEFRADPITVKKVLSNPKMKALTLAETVEVKGDKFVTTLTYLDKEKNEKHDLPVAGVFVEIGIIPNTEMLKGVAELDQYGRVVIDARNQRTSVEGIWAAGDCTNELYHQNNIAAGDAVKALEDIYVYLATK